MPSIDDIFGTYLKASSLQGKEPTVTIESVEVKKMQDGTQKLDIGFVGKEKHLLANKTNCTRIAFMHGNDYEEWIGKKIQLYTDLVDFQGKTVEAIRVRPVKAAEPARKAAPAPVDEFVDSIDDTF